MAVRCAAYAVDFVKMSKNTKLLHIRCVSQAQNVPKLVFGRGLGFFPNPTGGAYDAPQTQSRLGRGYPSHCRRLRRLALGAFDVSVLGASGASIDSTASSFSAN